MNKEKIKALALKWLEYSREQKTELDNRERRGSEYSQGVSWGSSSAWWFAAQSALISAGFSKVEIEALIGTCSPVSFLNEKEAS